MTQWILLLAGLYAGLCLLMFLLQDRLVFVGSMRSEVALDPPEGVVIDALPLPEAQGGGQFRIARGELPAERRRGVLLHFVGNGEDLESGQWWAHQWRAYGLEAVVVEYPGYGASDGALGVGPILAAAEVAAADAKARAAALGLPLFVCGVSIGSFSATHVASRPDAGVDGLILSAPPTTLVDAARSRFGWLPVGLMLRHRFDSLAVMPQIACPVWIVHGDRDGIVPQEQGRALAKAAVGSAAAQFVEAPGMGHMLPLHRGGPFGDRIAAFMFD